jgi:PAS domain S-box-containing protein
MVAESEFDKRLETLRRKAETRLLKLEADMDTEGLADPRRLLHELHVHQIELELQNEELRDAHTALERSRDRYMELYHHAPVGYVVTDSAGMILQANQTVGQMLDEALSALLDRPLSHLIHEADQPIFFSRFKAFYNNPTDKRMEVRMLRKDRSVVHIKLEGRRMDDSGALALKHDRSGLLFITISDVSQQKMAEKAILRAKRQWEQTFDAVPDLIAIIDEQSNIVRVNQALAKRLGVSPQACVGKACHDIFCDDGLPSTDCPHRRFLASGRPNQTEGYSKKLKGHFITTVTPFNTNDNRSSWCIHISHDVTDRKRIEQELLKLRNLESIGTLAGGIAHDFNNILTALVGNIELAALNLPEGDNTRSFLDGALRSAFKGRDLANRLLTFSKGGNPRNQPVMLDQLLQETVELCLSGSNVTHDLELTDRLEPMIVDAVQLKSAFQNIINNAREAMPWGGTLTIRAHTIEVTRSQDELIEPGTHVEITFDDQGAGIRPADLDKIFDPYFTTKQMGDQKGMGLGLAISHSIIKKHHGTIAVQSVEGQGTTVTVRLPLAPRSMTARSDAVSMRPEGNKPSLNRLLFLEDETGIWDVIRPLLQQMGCKADFVTNGKEAIAKYRRSLINGNPYALLMLDLTIRGGMGAKEIIRTLLAMDPGVKAAVFSGYSTDPVFVEYQRFGFVGALKKPFKADEFKSFVRRALDKPVASKRIYASRQ